jgi:2-polyprenyl-3-methyl-5-hydroxy-6-metoxy-1,4-benzoquinol methylase
MTMTSNNTLDKENLYRQTRANHWDAIAGSKITSQSWGRFYHEKLSLIYQFLVPPGLEVLEIGCGKGDLIASLKPSYGLGVDFSEEMVKKATAGHPDIQFKVADAHSLSLDRTFDIIILSDLVNDLWDVQSVFAQLKHLTKPSTRIILNLYSHLWEMPLLVAQRLGLATPVLNQNWLTVEDITNLLNITDFEKIHAWPEILWPFDTPLLEKLFNRFLAKIWPFKYFDLTNFVIARPKPALSEKNQESSVSVIVAARNEAGNINSIIERTPEMGSATELIFVEGSSTDNTFSAITEAINQYPDRKIKAFQQSGKGKGDAVRLGFSKATGDILMILDADMTVPPEDLPRFYEAVNSGKGEFINGVRLVYPMEKQAMRYLNLLGNKFFSQAFSWLLGQPIKDTLCGTKVLTKANYEKIAHNRSYFGDFDPFGDFDLLFGAAKLNLKIVEIPIRYAERTYGSTNISRWRHGVLLLRMVLFAAGRIKFF